MRRTFILGMTLLLVLASCSPAEDAAGDETTTTAGAGTTTEASSTDEATTTTEAAVETTTTTQQAATGGSSCVEGQWIFGSENFVDVMRSMMTETEMAGAEVEATDGTYLVTFGSDGSFTGERVDWGFSVGTSDGTFVIRMNGTEQGTWSADDSSITVSVDSSDVSVTARVESDEGSFDLPTSPVEVPETIAEVSSYQCDSNTLTVTTDEVTFVLDRA